MIFREFEEEVRAAIEGALREMGYPDSRIELLVPNKEGLGDLSCAVALQLARQAKRPPASIAEELERSINAAGNLRLTASVKAHSSGYLNFTLNWQRFAFGALSQALGGIGPFGLESKRVLIEHTNVNPNKSLHIGHARNLVLGTRLRG